METETTWSSWALSAFGSIIVFSYLYICYVIMASTPLPRAFSSDRAAADRTTLSASRTAVYIVQQYSYSSSGILRVEVRLCSSALEVLQRCRETGATRSAAYRYILKATPTTQRNTRCDATQYLVCTIRYDKARTTTVSKTGAHITRNLNVSIVSEIRVIRMHKRRPSASVVAQSKRNVSACPIGL